MRTLFENITHSSRVLFKDIESDDKWFYGFSPTMKSTRKHIYDLVIDLTTYETQTPQTRF